MSNLLFQTFPDELQAQCVVFSTPLGQAGVIVANERILRLSLGHSSRNKVLAELKKYTRHVADVNAGETPWLKSLTEAVSRFCAGEPTGFEDYDLWLQPKTEFQQRVFHNAHSIPYGETWSYKQLAESVGSPRAARAIGNVMASNPLPVLIPCHRVIGSDGKLHGFSAPQGTDLKHQMLQLEALAVAD